MSPPPRYQGQILCDGDTFPTKLTISPIILMFLCVSFARFQTILLNFRRAACPGFSQLRYCSRCSVHCSVGRLIPDQSNPHQQIFGFVRASYAINADTLGNTNPASTQYDLLCLAVCMNRSSSDRWMCQKHGLRHSTSRDQPAQSTP